MIELNTNYDDLIVQYNKVRDSIYKDSSPLACLSYFQTCRVLDFFYLLSTGKHISIGKNKYNRKANFRAQEKCNQIQNKYHQNFLINQKFHYEMVSSVLSEMIDVLDEFYESDYYNELLSKYQAPIQASKGEDLDILHHFFKTVDPDTDYLFSELIEKKRFYELNCEIISQTGITLFDSVNQLCNVFIRKRVPSIASLATYVHEMGHVKDNLDLATRFSPTEEKSYIYKSIYGEVLSTTYEQKFYEYLIDNNIHKEETILATMKYFDNYSEALANSALYAALPEQYHLSASAGLLTFNQMANIVEGIMDEEESEYDYIPCLDDSLGYSYGLIIANHILDDVPMFDRFLNIRNGFFRKDDLTAIGITPQDSPQKVLKNMKKIYTK